MTRFLVILLLWAHVSEARWMSKKEAGSVIEKFNVSYDVKKNGAWSQVIDYSVRVQSEDAKTSASQFTIEYNSMTDKVDVLEAYTLNGKTRTDVEASAIEDRDKGEARDYDAMKVRSVVFPQVQIGSRLFIKYRMSTSKPIIEDRWSDVLTLGPGVWVEAFKLNIVSERPLFYDLSDPRGLVSVKQKDKMHLEASNKREIPGWVHAEKDAYFHPGGNTYLWISTEKDWPKFMSVVNSDFDKIQASGVPVKLAGWMKEAAKKKTPEEQILALMERMSRDFRYFGDWRRHNGGIVPRPLNEIEKSRYGDCKDLSSLLTAMLRAMKIPANVALIRRGDNPYGHEPDYALPAVNRFNHAIVQVKLADGKTFWLDPTNPVSSLKPFPDIAGRPAWILDPKGAYFDRTPPSTPDDFQHVHDYEYRFKSDDEVAVRVNATLKNLASHNIANELMLSSRSAVLSNTLDYFSEGLEVKSFKYVKEPKTGRAIADMPIVLDYDSGRVTFSAGKGSFFVIPDGFLNGPFYETEDRESDLKLSQEPYSFKGVRRLKDTRLVQEVPATCRVDSEWMTLERVVKSEGRDVLVSQQVDLKKPYIRKEEFRTPAFKRLQAETKRCFYRTGILVEPLKGSLSLNAQ
ncbi:MAG: DUF3857 domain-containing transglutaminase family protein [Bdellovibrionales bacterium]|nr:DUF3857 domain-containing transglutaminase family protein [Bdellovibrionales bacterium]